MKKNILLQLSILIAIMASNFALGSEQYICTAYQSTGFSYNKLTKEWENTHFKTNNKYIFSEAKNNKYTYKISRFGTKDPFLFCSQTYSSFGSIQCNESFIKTGFDFRFNKESGRYLLIMPMGYFFVRPNGKTDTESDTPYMEIGKCLEF